MQEVGFHSRVVISPGRIVCWEAFTGDDISEQARAEYARAWC